MKHSTVAAHPLLAKRPFEYIKSGRISRYLDAWHNEIQSDKCVQKILERTEKQKITISTDLKTRVTSKGRLRVKKFYWTLQCHIDDKRVPFVARTLVVLPDMSFQWHDFPDDPVLTSATQLMSVTSGTRVLQYVPLRRLTLVDTSTTGITSVLKLKQRSRTVDAHRRLQALNECLSGRECGFTLAEDLGLCSITGTHRQSFIPGVPLSAKIGKNNALTLVSKLAKKLSRFHQNVDSRLPVEQYRKENELKQQISWICTVLPQMTDQVIDLYNWLVSNQEIQTNTSICHGDLSLDQILVNKERWSLIDMDHAHKGDPIRDLARLLGVLSSELAHLRIPTIKILQTFCDAYGYRISNTDAMHTLRWYCCRYEIEQLSIMLRKDLKLQADRLACLDRAKMHMQGSSNELF